mgnify:CR=1 FL=1
MKTILITGINGFLGSHLAKALSADYNIVGLEYSLENLFRMEGSNIKIYSSKEDLEKIFKLENICAIIHAATIYRINKNEPLEVLINTNILLPIKLFELAGKYRCELFLNTDTFFNDVMYNYSYLPDYTLSKKQVLEWIKLISGKCKFINMKIFHMYGPNDSLNKFIPQMIERFRENEKYINTTLGEQTRDFIYIDDVVKAYQIILEANHELSHFQEFQIGTGKSIMIKELLLTIKTIVKSNSMICLGKLPYRSNEIMNSCAENSKLLSLGWSPKYSLNKGIEKILKNL